ncbi:MAG TPA: hypothetical protein VE153_37890 [Myxococcus sp.]|nr:hypothetical protein [Myxococcus sp.]
MAHPIKVDFNALPRSVRERFVDSTGPRPQFPPVVKLPGITRMPVTRWFLFGIFPLSTSFLSMWAGGSSFRMLREAGPVPWLLLGWWSLLFFLIALGLRLAFNHFERKSLPFTPGQYFFPTHLVDARSRKLRITPLEDLTGIEQRHMYVNGVYDGTGCLFTFREGPRQFIEVNDRAGTWVREFNRQRDLYVRAAQQGDLETQRQYNPFFDMRCGGLEPGSGPLALDVPGFIQKRWLVAFGLSLALSPSAWLLKLWADNLRFQGAQQAGTAQAYYEYAERGGRHVAEARELGAQANIRECEKNDTELCWRGFMRRWSDSPLRPQVRTERLPRAALQEASGSVAGLQRFLEEYPNSVVDAEARSRLAALQGKASGTPP